MDYSERIIYFFTKGSITHFVFIFVFCVIGSDKIKKTMRNKKNFRKPAPRRESPLEVARHNAYYEQFNTAYKATFGFAYLVLLMLFVANLFFSASIFGFFGVVAVTGSTFYSYLSQKDFYSENKKRGILFQITAIGFGCISFICLCLSYFYQLTF